VTKLTHRINKPPKPTLTDPLAAVMWVFFQLEREKSEGTAPNFRHARSTYIRYLAETNSYYIELEQNPRFYLDKYWEPDALIRFTKWLSSQKSFTSKTRYSLYKTVRQAMDWAYALGLITDIVYHPPMFKGVSETKERAAYNDQEQEVINAALARWISLGISIVNGYSPTGLGIPRNEISQNISLNIDGKSYSVLAAKKAFHVSETVIRNRLRKNWSHREAVGLDQHPDSIHPITVGNKTYKSRADAARAHGVLPERVTSRLAKGWTIEEALGIVSRETSSRPVTINGIYYESISKAAKAYSLNHSVLSNRLYSGWTPEEAVGTKHRRGALQKILIRGVTYKSATAAAKAYNQNKKTFCNRLSNGWTHAQAASIEPPPPRSYTSPAQKGLEVKGVYFKTIAAAAKFYSFDNNLIYQRLKAGWTPEQALELEQRHLEESNEVIPIEKVKSKVSFIPKEISVGDEIYPSIKAAAKAHGLQYKTVVQRRLLNWTIDETFELTTRERTDCTKIIVEGVEYPSLSSVERAYGVHQASISNRLGKGWTPEQAVGIVPRYVKVCDDRFALWDFENTFKSNARAMLESYASKIVTCYPQKRLLKLFKKWGVWPYIDRRLIMPLATELAMLTGLNPEAIRDLELDSYMIAHPLTEQPCIQYVKDRGANSTSSRNKALHIPLLEMEEYYPDESIIEKIDTLITLVKSLTSIIRPHSPKEIANRLFIFHDHGQRVPKDEFRIVPINWHSKGGTWRSIFAREEGLYDRFGKNFNFNVARCRPTLATNMVLAGVDIFQVQIALGHKSILTTGAYLDDLQVRPKFNATLSDALQQIAKRSKNILPKKKEHLEESKYLLEGFHETLSGCGCKNPYSPSKNIRESTNFKEGAPCKHWNMCLLCDNSIITPNSLPKLISYRDKVQDALKTDSPTVGRRTELYKDTVKLINGILEPDEIFPSNILNNAHKLAAELDDVMLDQLVYQGF